MTAPNSYKDPYWADLAGRVEAKLDLPAGLLQRIVTHGERSNSDQVSKAGARTPFQIIPETRNAAIKKWGIDPYLSPENASEVAGLLLKDSLQRNGGKISEAVGEYHGGTDRSGWGPRTQAYINRVMIGLKSDERKAAQQGKPESTFDRVKASMQASQPPSLAGVFEAYQAGRMTREEERALEADVRSGLVMLPKGMLLKGEKAAPPANTIPTAVVAAYRAGNMTPEERAQFEDDVRSGIALLPDGIAIGQTAGEEQEPPGLVARLADVVTGNLRRTTESSALPEWTGMPELNQFSMSGLKTGLGTLLANPSEAVKVIQANFPGVQVRQDPKGNFVLRSSLDDREYVIPPGFTTGDIPRALAGLLAFTPAGRSTTLTGMAAGGAATQAVIEGSQAATGGEFNPSDVAVAAVMPPLVATAGRLVAPAAQGVRSVAQRMRNGPAVATSDDSAAMAAATRAGEPTVSPPLNASQGVPDVAPAPASPAAGPHRAMPVDELAQTARKAVGGGLGSRQASQALAAQAAPDPAVLSAAKRLGITEYLQPDHVTTSQAYRELAQAVKSVPSSQARASEIEGLERVSRRAADLIDEIGGTTDLSALSATVRSSMQATQQQLDREADRLYSKLRASVPAQAEAPAPNVLSFIQQRASDLGGESNLSGMERMILRKLTPRTGSRAELIHGSAGGGLMSAPTHVAREMTFVRQPTYALLDDVRRDLTAARVQRAGPFKDSDSGLIKKLEKELMKDQRAALEPYGMLPTFDAARGAVAVRKGLEDDLVALFGRDLDATFVGTGGAGLPGAVRALAQGDSERLVRLITAVPEGLRPQVVASGIATAFRSAGTRGEISFAHYAKWYEGLMRNRKAYAAVMSSLPLSARKQLHALYKVADGISKASKERITTGRINAVSEHLKDADTLAARLYETAQRSAAGAVAGTVAAPVVGPGAAAAIASAVTSGPKQPAIRAVDELIASPEFAHMVKAGAGQPRAAAAKRMARSAQFIRFVRAVGDPSEFSNRERWIMQAIQASEANRR